MIATSPLRTALLPAALAVALAALHLWTTAGVDTARLAELMTGATPDAFADIRVTQAVLPRVVMGLIVGAGLGLAGSLFQQVTGNRLASPLTLGASSGAWLAMVVATLAAPALAASAREWVSLAGATAAFGLVVGIAGLRGLMGLRAVLGGMAVNLLLGSIAGGIVLLQSPYFGHLFVWGAGDLGQSGWDRTLWAAPRLGAAALGILACSRILGLLRPGAGAAEARGLSLRPWLVLLAALALYLTAVSVAAVGMIGFIGLLAPTLARAGGARRPLTELVASAFLGAALLSGADLVAVGASGVLRDMVPTGAAAALAGAPALVLLMRRRLAAADHGTLEMPHGPARPAAITLAGIGGLSVLALLLAVFVSPGEDGWRIAVPDALTLSFRWPRILAAAGAGGAMALSGVILQRLIRNPLASPDILGMSSGATLALVLTSLVGGVSIHTAGVPVALLGSAAVMVALLLLARRHAHAPMVVALVGISLGALLDALVKIALAAGTADSFALLGWLGGSTYRVTGGAALALAGLAVAACLGLRAAHRWLTLIGTGDATAAARGLPVGAVRTIGLAVAAGLAGTVTALMGPVSFVGLVAPHAATMIGARTAGAQTWVAAWLGAVLMVGSDWLGRTLIYPMQLPAGIIAACLGGGYFIALLIRQRLAARRSGMI
ncbi:Fe(3+)-hydroxamate ABC transporter permease FhuB [Roseivivax marinus]|uniref:Fe(3+)-hydroxamate ABC transporter permease FhuB n=1 Tax=Roseivivax marinus TaxID=1379903 RepID=UPI00273F7016|nr:Fe(3+)-hydroxamate ABC transporter permease FhuB [Roseivivax marinus]